LKNPIEFKLDSFSTIYDIPHIKSQLRSSGHAMPFTTAVHTVSYYARCDDYYFLNDSMCSLSPCIPCPDYFNYKCCVKIEAPMYNMNGEFRKHHALELEAGHVMVLAGYNDEYQTEDGMKGGFIMRNSWIDGVYSLNEFGERKARGSHSLAFFMQQISPANERAICPNSANPRNWYPCGGSNLTNIDSVKKDCLSNDNKISSLALKQPYHLKCRNAKLCDVRPSVTYYLIKYTRYGDDLFVFALFQYDTSNNQGIVKYFTPMPIDSFADIIGPVSEEDLLNSDDHCGYYFFPYDLISESSGLFQSFFVNDYHLTFSDKSYLSSETQNPTLDYSLLRSSTKVQTSFPTFPSVYPNIPPNT